MTKQTVIEWLREIYNSRNTYEKFIANIDWEQAKAMEKEQYLTMSDYNLEELAKEFAIQQLADPKEYDTSIYAATIQNTYMVGFQKALELLTFKSE